jgi:hypothetical protein
MVTSATALAVAVLSGCASIYTARSTQRVQRDLQVAADRITARSERAAALAGYGAAAATFLAACTELAGELAPGTRDPARCTAKRDTCQERWARLREVRLPATAHAGTHGALRAAIQALDEAAQTLHDAMGTWFDEVRRYDWRTDKRRPDSVQSARRACEQALTRFEEVAGAMSTGTE